VDVSMVDQHRREIRDGGGLDDLPKSWRPREKLMARGPGSLSSAELLALVIGSGGRVGSGRRLAERLVRRHGIRQLAEMPAREYLGERGVGPAYAARLSAVFELGRRTRSPEIVDPRPVLSGPRQVFAEVRQLATARREHLVGMYLDAQNRLLHRETISIGSLNTTRAHPREILYPAIVNLALGFILAHNHPSGCLDPSPEDVEFTRAVRRAGELMGIELYDHLVIARGGFTSMRERGLF